jgi:hypothetical protein
MAMRKLGGEVGTFLVTACNVLAGHQDAIAVGKFVRWNTAANWQVNSCADSDPDLMLRGVVVGLNDNSSIATVKWLGWNRIAEFDISGTPVLGSSVETETANGSKIAGTSNTTLAAYNYVVGVDGTTKVHVAFR